jgi:hypothetical protein
MIGRRGFLASALAAGVFSQFRFARAATPMKVMFVYVPDGCIPSLWHPTGGETGFTLPEMSAPLEAIREHCVFLKGLNMYSGGATHEGGIRKVLTGVGPVSLDVFLGQKLQGSAPHASVQLGVSANFQNGSGSMSFTGTGQEVKPDDNPINAFERLFGGSTTKDDSAAILARKRKKSVLDAALADLSALQLTGAEKDKLQTNLDSIREVEKRLDTAVPSTCSIASWNSEGFKISPTDYYPKTYEKEDLFGTVGKLQQDLAILALGCDITHSASLMWSHPVSPTKVPGLGVTMNNHDASHYGSTSTANAKEFVKMKRWFAQRFVELIQSMAARPYGSSTLLDHTLVLLCSELGDANAHDHKSVPFVLAGGKAAGLRGGRALDFTGKGKDGENEAHTKLLVSMAKYAGVAIDSFGYTGHGTGGLTAV